MILSSLAPPAPEYRCGFGADGTFARRFLNVDVATGSAINYRQDVINGDSFSIDATGIYVISSTDFSWPGDTFSISLN